MPDFAAEDAFLLRDVLMVAFSWNEERAIQHLEETWRQGHLQQDQDKGAEDPGDLAKQAQDKKKMHPHLTSSPSAHPSMCCRRSQSTNM